MSALVVAIKRSVRIKRPDSDGRNSFPSGHTTQAFSAATFMAKEYGWRNGWYTVGAYTMATTVGVVRVLNNRHWISDILAGAGIGVLSTNLVYLTHQHKWGKKNTNALTITPTYENGNAGFYLCYKL